MLLVEKDLKELLRLYKKIHPNALEITAEGIFFALGSPLKSRNTSEVEGGIFMPFGPDFDKDLILKEAVKGVYFCDRVVQ